MAAHTFNPRIPEIEADDLCEFGASLVYTNKFWAKQSYIVRPCLKIKKKNKNKISWVWWYSPYYQLLGDRSRWISQSWRLAWSIE